MKYDVGPVNNSLRIGRVAKVKLSLAGRPNVIARHIAGVDQSFDHSRSYESASTGHNHGLAAPEPGIHCATTTASQRDAPTGRGSPRTNGSFRGHLLPKNTAGTSQ